VLNTKLEHLDVCLNAGSNGQQRCSSTATAAAAQQLQLQTVAGAILSFNVAPAPCKPQEQQHRSLAMSRSLKQPSVLPEALEAVTGIAQCDHSSPLGADAKAVIAAAVSHFGAQWRLHDRQITQRGHMVKRYTWQAENMSGKSAKQLMFRANERGLLPEKVGLCTGHREQPVYLGTIVLVL
jgi:hypothetical protein